MPWSHCGYRQMKLTRLLIDRWSANSTDSVAQTSMLDVEYVLSMLHAKASNRIQEVLAAVAHAINNTDPIAVIFDFSKKAEITTKAQADLETKLTPKLRDQMILLDYPVVLCAYVPISSSETTIIMSSKSLEHFLVI